MEMIKQQEQDNLLIKAITNGNLDEVNNAIKNGANVNRKLDPYHWEDIITKTILYAAVTPFSVAALGYRMFFGNSKKPEANTTWWTKGDTVLHLAVRLLGSKDNNDAFKIIQALVASGADIDARNEQWETPYNLIPDEHNDKIAAEKLLEPKNNILGYVAHFKGFGL